MPLKLVPTSQFKKDLKRIRKRGYDLDALEIVLDKLCACQPLENRNHDHALSGNYVGFREWVPSIVLRKFSQPSA